MARMTKDSQERDILMAALEGLELQKQRIDEQIAVVRERLGDKPARASAAPAAPAAASSAASSSAAAAAPKEKGGKKKRVLSAAARKRIAAAQKARWEAYRKQQESK